MRDFVSRKGKILTNGLAPKSINLNFATLGPGRKSQPDGPRIGGVGSL